MKIKVNTPNNKFVYNCETLPRIKETIVYKNNSYIVRGVYYYVDEDLDTIIEVDVWKGN